MKVEEVNKEIKIISAIDKIETPSDFLEVLMGCGGSSVIIYKEDLSDAFFDLKSKLAGECLQKVSNYRKRVAIIGDYSMYDSKSLRDFIYESNKTKQILFVGSVDEALSIWGIQRKAKTSKFN